jgi:hypothetical protein
MKKENVCFLVVLIGSILCNHVFAQAKTKVKPNELCINFQGKPFFPIGFYYYPDSILDPDNKELDLIAKAGFNTLHIDIKDSSNCLLFFDQCHKKGLKIIAQFGNGFGTYSMGDVSFLSYYKNHPALLGWSIADDANNGKYVLDTISMRQNMIKTQKPNLPTFLSVYQNYEKGISLAPEDLLKTGDVLSFEMYPIDSWGLALGAFKKEEELLETERELTAFQDINFKKFNKILVAIPQTFTWASYSKNKEARLLEADELRNLTYTGIINGAKGVLNYTFGQKEIVEKEIPTFKLTSAPNLWLESAAIAKELAQLKDVYLNGSRTKIDMGKDGWLRLSVWKYNKKTYIIVSNLHKTMSQNLDYKLPVSGKIENIFKERNASVSHEKGYLKGSIPPKQVQIYQISN